MYFKVSKAIVCIGSSSHIEAFREFCISEAGFQPCLDFYSSSFNSINLTCGCLCPPSGWCQVSASVSRGLMTKGFLDRCTKSWQDHFMAGTEESRNLSEYSPLMVIKFPSVAKSICILYKFLFTYRKVTEDTKWELQVCALIMCKPRPPCRYCLFRRKKKKNPER